MNWLGQLILPYIEPNDSVLDLGCGMVSATGNIGANHFAVDCYVPYLEELSRKGMKVLMGHLPGIINIFLQGSWDHVLLLDVVEHLKKEDAITTIIGAKNIARKSVFINTPKGFVNQTANDLLGGGKNKWQQHLCGFEQSELIELEFETAEVSMEDEIHLFGKHLVGRRWKNDRFYGNWESHLGMF